MQGRFTPYGRWQTIAKLWPRLEKGRCSITLGWQGLVEFSKRNFQDAYHSVSLSGENLIVLWVQIR